MATVPVYTSPVSSGDSLDEKEKDLTSIHESDGSLGDKPASSRSRFAFWRKDRRDMDSIATQPSVFDDTTTLEKYRPPPSYENAHRFDPSARWTWREELV